MKKISLEITIMLMLSLFAGCKSSTDSSESFVISENSAESTVQSEVSEILQNTVQSEIEKSWESEELSETVESETIEKSFEVSEEVNQEMLLRIDVNGSTFYADFEDNSSADALAEKLKDGAVTIYMNDYGNFEKVGNLPFELPRNDVQITTQPGDIILYLGNELTIYYDTNSWNFTRVAKIRNADGQTLRDVLGDGDVTAVISVE